MNKKNIASILVLVLIMVFNGLAISQEKHKVTFEVNDGKNPIEFANIFINPCSCGGVTDVDGNFSIELKEGSHQVITSYIGFNEDTLDIEVQESSNFRIQLNSEGYILSGVTVSASDAREQLEKTVMGVQQLNIEKIKTLPTAIGEIDILKSLVMLSGVGSAGEASNGLSVRGGSLDQNLVLLDKAPVYNTTHLFGLFSVFTPDAIRGVDLFQANMPSKYGGRISSIVDVKVENPSLDQLSLDGGIGLVSNRITLNTPLKKGKIGLLIGGRASYNDFLFSAVKKLKNTKANFIDATMKLRYQINPKNNLYLTTFYSQDFYQLEINSKINSIASDANQYDYSTLNNTLTWISDIGKKSFIQTNFIRSIYRPKILFPQSAIDNVVTFSSSIDNYGLHSEYFNAFSEKFILSAGFQADQTTVNPGELVSEKQTDIQEQTLMKEKGVELALYANLDWNVSSNFSMSMGLRYSHFLLLGPYNQAIYLDEDRRAVTSITEYSSNEVVQQYGYPEPRFGMRYKVGENISLKASYALTRQYLQNIYNSTTPLPTSRWKMADAYIKPQTGHTYSVGYYHNFLDNVFTFGIESYYRTIENVLDYKPGADFFLQEYIEKDVLQGRGENYGIEFNLEKSRGRINGWCNYAYSRSLRKFTANLVSDRINNNQWFPSDFDRPHVFNGTMNIEANPFNTISLNFTYQTGRPYTIPAAVITTESIPVPIFVKRNNSRLPDYHRMDLSWRIHNITTKNTRWKGDWVFTLYNLYNRNNAFNIYFAGKEPGQAGSNIGAGPLAAYKLSIFSTTMVSVGYNFHFE